MKTFLVSFSTLVLLVTIGCATGASRAPVPTVKVTNDVPAVAVNGAVHVYTQQQQVPQTANMPPENWPGGSKDFPPQSQSQTTAAQPSVAYQGQSVAAPTYRADQSVHILGPCGPSTIAPAYYNSGADGYGYGSGYGYAAGISAPRSIFGISFWPSSYTSLYASPAYGPGVNAYGVPYGTYSTTTTVGGFRSFGIGSGYRYNARGNYRTTYPSGYTPYYHR